MLMPNSDGLRAKELAELRDILADPSSPTDDREAAQQVLAQHKKEHR